MWAGWRKMKQDGLAQYLGRASSGTFAVYGAGMVLAFATQILLTRILGAAQYGSYYFVLAWVMALLIPAKLGLDAALLRFVPAYIARREWGLLKGILRWSSRKAALASLGIAGLLAATVTLLDDVEGEFAVTFYLGSLLLPVLVYVYLRSALLRSLKHVVLALLPEAVIAPVVLGASVILYWSLVKPDLTAAHAMAATLGGLAVSGLVGQFLLTSRIPGELQRHAAELDAGVWLRSTGSMLLISGAHVLLNHTDLIMLGVLGDTYAVGIYAVAAKAAVLVSFPLTIANSSIAPLISQFHSTAEHAQLQRALDHSMKRVAMASLVAFVGVVFFGRELLAIFGAEFVEGYAALVILATGALVNALSGPCANLLSLTGSEGYVSRVMLLVTVLNVILNLLFIPRWGIEGAAFATAISMVTWNLVMFVAAGKRLGLAPNSLISWPKVDR